MDLRLFTKTTPEMETSKTSSVLWHTQTYTNQLRHSHLPAWLGHHISASEYVSLKSHNPSPADALCVCACVFSLCWFCSDCDRSWTVASGSESQCASAKAMTQLTTKSTHRVAKQTALTRNKGGGKLVHFRLVGKIKKTKQKKLFLFPWRRHPRAQREPVPLCALPSQELVVINKATHEIIFWANILIKTVPSVTCMLYFHLVPISPTLSSKTDRQESRTQVVPSGKRTVEWKDNVFFNSMSSGLHDQSISFRTGSVICWFAGVGKWVHDGLEVELFLIHTTGQSQPRIVDVLDSGLQQLSF